MARDIFSGRRIRERIPAKLRKQALEKAKHTCQYPRCKNKIFLQAHHINLKNDNTRLSNIKMLCPTCHAKVHYKQSKKYKMEQKRKKRNRDKLLIKKKKELKLLERKKKKVMKVNALKKKKLLKRTTKKKKIRRRTSSFLGLDEWDSGF